MDASLSTDQKTFWESILCVARLARSRKAVDFRAARDALEIEELATKRLEADATPAEPATTGGATDER